MCLCLQALFHTGNMEESISHFLKSLKILGSKQPSSKFKLYQSLMKNASSQWKHHYFPQSDIENSRCIFIFRSRFLSLSLSSYTSTSSRCNFNSKKNPGFVEQHLQLAYFGILWFSKDMSETSFMKR